MNLGKNNDDNVTAGITSDGDTTSGGTMRLYNPDTMLHGDVLAPRTLIAFAVLCVGLMLVVLGRAILLEMEGAKVPVYEPAIAIAWAFFGFVLPAITANAIMMNWSSSRWLIVLLVAGVGNLIIYDAPPEQLWLAEPWVIASVVAVALIVVCWLFASKSTRLHYSRLAEAAQAEA